VWECASEQQIWPSSALSIDIGTLHSVSAADFNRTRHKAIIIGLAQTGAREGEILSLAMDSYDHEKLSVVFSDTKTDEDREVPIKREWVDVVNEYLKWRPDASLEDVVCQRLQGSDDTGRLWPDVPGYAGLSQPLPYLRKKAEDRLEGMWGVPRSAKGLAFGLQVGSARSAALCGEKLCDIAGIGKAKEILGHKSIATTQLYNHVGKSSLRSAFDAADLLPLNEPADEPPIIVNKRTEKCANDDWCKCGGSMDDWIWLHL
jgi:integrase